MKGAVPFNIISIPATVDVAAKRFITPAGALAADTDSIVAGVSQHSSLNGQEITIQTAGIAEVECGGDITIHTEVTSGADGKATAWSTAGYVHGIALDAGANGRVIRVLLKPYHK